MRWLLVLVAVSLARPLACHNGQIRTDKDTRKVFKCKDGKWAFHAMMLRPTRTEPNHKAYMSMKCEHNPNLSGTIAGFPCDEAHHDHHILACGNTKITYICFEKKWHIYEINNKK